MSTSTETPSRRETPAEAGTDAASSVRDALAAARTQHGESLLAVSERGPLLLVFLRHFG